MGGTVESDGLVIPDQRAAERDTTRCEIVLGLLARKWMIPILVELAAAPRRRQYLFVRLKVSSSRLDPTIQELMRWGLIERAWIPNGRSDGPGIAISALGRSMLDLVTTLLAEGVRQVIITTEDLRRYAGVRLPDGAAVWDRSRLGEAVSVLSAVEGVTVLVHDQECATEKRRRRKRGTLEEPKTRILINEAVCEGCGDCGIKSNCLSVHPVQTELGRKTQIHQPSCNLDYSCVQGNCPSFVKVVPGPAVRPRRGASATLGADDLPEPTLRVPADEFGMRIAGIGGTGVVTVAQTLATAALLDGRFVRGLDQTGLAQKGGPVISDLRITTSPMDQANKLTVADCDLFLACDVLVGAQQQLLTVTDSERTVAVTSTAQVPTGQMVVDTDRCLDPVGPQRGPRRPGHRRAALRHRPGRQHPAGGGGISDRGAALAGRVD